MEGLCVEYKNYSIPIKEEKPMRTLVKTVISFLNSKGGTIYIGVEDSKGEVKGV
jgi:predicted HTH transcriptional regulator